MVGLQRHAVVASNAGDRCNRAAIAVQRIGGHNLALERDQAKHFKPCVQFAAVAGSHRHMRQTKAPSVPTRVRHLTV